MKNLVDHHRDKLSLIFGIFCISGLKKHVVFFISLGLVGDRPNGATHVRVNGATHGC